MTHITKRVVRTQSIGPRNKVTVVEDWHRIELEQAEEELRGDSYDRLISSGTLDIVAGNKTDLTGERCTEYRVVVPAPVGGDESAADEPEDLEPRPDDLDA